MPSNKELFYQMIDRDLDNLIMSLVPVVSNTFPIVRVVLPSYMPMIKSTIIKKYISPLVEGFITDDVVESSDIDMMTDYVKDEVTSKIEEFKKRYKSSVDNQN